MSDEKKTICWGIIGCGDVCEVKSGPAFNKVPNSKLVAVMRRNALQAEDYARRHGVPTSYSDAGRLIRDPEINAIYIATPPSSHEEYAIQSIKAGKPVYIEKPISTDSGSTQRILEAAQKHKVRATGAYYRRRLPLFEKVKQLVHSGELGKISLISIRLFLAQENNTIAQTETNWRLNPEISGGGLFHDLAPHMLDILFWIFGKPEKCNGFSLNQGHVYDAPDFASVHAVFPKEVVFNGLWSFHVHPESGEDVCEIIGSRGKLRFSFFDQAPLEMISEERKTFHFENPENIQFPMIRDTVNYFRGEGKNPCPISETLVSMEMMDSVR